MSVTKTKVVYLLNLFKVYIKTYNKKNIRLKFIFHTSKI